MGPKTTSRSGAIGLVVAATLGLVGASSSPAAVGSGHSGWNWGSPLPQGEAIQAVELQGEHGYAAGKFGTLLRTDDAGATWSGLATGTTEDLDRVAIIDTDSAVVSGGCTVRRTDDSGLSFKRLPWTASDERCAAPVVALAFPSDQRGYLMLDDGTVFQTRDGGLTWSRQTNVPTGGIAPVKATDIAFTQDDVGIAVTSAGLVYRTTDGAASWTEVKHAAHALRGAYFVTPNVGFAVGDDVEVLRSVNGGATWSEETAGTGTSNLTSIRCANALVCLASTEVGDRLLRTVDGGVTFSAVTPSSEKIFAAAFASPLRAVAAGGAGTTVTSDDAGLTWAPVGEGLTGSFTRLRATSSSLAFAAGREGLMARTLDGGRTWSTIGVSTAEDVIDLSFVSREVGFALDAAGAVLRTDNGGQSWQILNTGSSARSQAILALDSDVVLLIGPHGIRRSHDGGANFSRVPGRRVAPVKLFDADRGGGAIFAYGSKSMIVSRNKGKSWRKVRLPRRALLSAVDFVTSRLGFALGQDGRVFKTRNGGRRWSDLAGVGSDDGIGLSFGSASKGYLVLSRFGDDSNGYVLRTSDGGRTWRPQLVTSASVLSNGLAAAGGTDFLLEGGNSFFFTTSGGDQGDPSSVKIKTRRRTVRRKTTITVTGRVGGALAGSTVLVARRQIGESGWDFQTARIAANDTFTTTWKIPKTSIFVAQWLGDDDQAGDGSTPLTVRARHR
jgi:photosystem II stability/assembly factor-like uncharacterized protein